MQNNNHYAVQDHQYRYQWKAHSDFLGE